MIRNTMFGVLTLAGALTAVAVGALSNPGGSSPRSAEAQSAEAQTASSSNTQLALASVQSSRSSAEAGCSPWDVSDVAMEAALSEMIRRGWRPPTQQEALEAFQPLQGPMITSLEPNAPVPVRRPSTSSAASSETEPEELLPVIEIEPDEPVLPVEPATAEPSIEIDEPTPAPAPR